MLAVGVECDEWGSTSVVAPRSLDRDPGFAEIKEFIRNKILTGGSIMIARKERIIRWYIKSYTPHAVCVYSVGVEAAAIR